jgi:hypothetical protein
MANVSRGGASARDVPTLQRRDQRREHEIHRLFSLVGCHCNAFCIPNIGTFRYLWRFLIVTFLKRQSIKYR